MVSGVNVGGASGENINKENEHDATRYPPQHILKPSPPWPSKI